MAKLDGFQEAASRDSHNSVANFSWVMMKEIMGHEPEVQRQKLESQLWSKRNRVSLAMRLRTAYMLEETIQLGSFTT